MTNYPTAAEIQQQSEKTAEAWEASRAANAYKDPLQAFRSALADGSFDRTVKAFCDPEPEPAKLTIAEVCERVRQLLEDCDGDSSVVLQECLETLEADMREPEPELRDPEWRDGPYTTV